MNFNSAEPMKIILLILISSFIILIGPKEVSAQKTCNDYLDFMDNMVIELFTSEQTHISRESAFPSFGHKVIESEIRRLNFPQEQSICDGVLNKIYKNDPIKGPTTHHALYKIKDLYFMIIYKYYTASVGSQLIEDPTVGALYDQQFNRISFIAM
jgi:hypothetical protein